MKLKYLIGTGGTLRDKLKDELVIKEAFIEALDLIESNHSFHEEIDEEEIIGIIVSKVIVKSNMRCFKI